MRSLLLPALVAASLLAAGCPQTPTTAPAPSPSAAATAAMSSGSAGTPTMTHTTSASAAEKPAPTLDAFPKAKAVKVTASAKGFTPATLKAKKGEPFAIEFTRIDDKTCATEVVFPDMGLEAKLPLDTPVRVSFKPEGTGDLAFACGMGMFHGKVVVAAK